MENTWHGERLLRPKRNSRRTCGIESMETASAVCALLRPQVRYNRAYEAYETAQSGLMLVGPQGRASYSVGSKKGRMSCRNHCRCP